MSNVASFQSAFEKSVEAQLNPAEIECETCKATFFQTSYFKGHVCIPKQIRLLACDFCHKLFQSKRHLNQHCRVHLSDKPYQCPVCKKRFPQKNYMEMHLLIHSTVDKPFKCKLCDKSYAQLDSLKQHMYTHTGETRYRCEHCGKGFRILSNMRMHQATHETGNSFNKDNTIHKPFKCDSCGRSFSMKRSLDRHSFIHSGERPFKCNYCPKEFARKDYLSAHIRLTHEKETTVFEKCPVCDKRFMFKSRLDRHMKVHARLGCLFCGRSTDECSCSGNPQKDLLAKENFLIKCQTCSKIILRRSQLKIRLRRHRDYNCVVCNEDYRICNCSDDLLQVSKITNTYTKTISDKPVETLSVRVKEEEDDEDIFNNELDDNKKRIELTSEVFITKEEPKEDYFEIGANSAESYADTLKDIKKEEYVDF